MAKLRSHKHWRSFVMQKDVLADTGLENLSQPSRFSHSILWIAALFFLVAFIWAKLAVLDEATVAQGKVIPSSRLQVIQNLEGGIVQRIEVREGEAVKKDQLLMTIDDTQFSSSYDEGIIKVQMLRAKIARLYAEATNKFFLVPEDLRQENPEVVKREEDLYKTEIAQLASQKAELTSQLTQRSQELQEAHAKKEQLERSYELVAKELSLTKPLVAQGAVSIVELLRLERTANDTKGDLNATTLSIPRLAAQLTEVQAKIESLNTAFYAKSQDELNKASAELVSELQKNKALQDRVRRTSVRSPVNGRVSKIYVNTIGGVIQPGMDLMDIVPTDDTLLVQAFVKPKDIAFLSPGQRAMVKITAYDFSVYGGLEGTLEYIGADAIENKDDPSQKGQTFYEVHVRTKKNYLGTDAKPLPIIPGMVASVDIITGQKSVLDYIMKPIFKARTEALKER